MDYKLYTFEPQGYGSDIFVTVAQSREEAYSKLNLHILEQYTTKFGSLRYEAYGWGTDYYKCTEHTLSKILNFETS